MEGQPEILLEEVLVDDDESRGRSGRQGIQPQGSKLHVVRHLIQVPDHLHFFHRHLSQMLINLEPRDWSSNTLSPQDNVSALFPSSSASGVSPIRPRLDSTTPARSN